MHEIHPKTFELPRRGCPATLKSWRLSARPSAPASAGVEVMVDRWVRGSSVHTTDRVAEEVPVALLYNGEPHVVMLATPQDLEDLARGFSLSEELVDAPDEIRGIEVHTAARGSAEVRIAIAWERFPELLRRRRNLTGRTGCGLCGAETLEQTVRTQSGRWAQVPRSVSASCMPPSRSCPRSDTERQARAACMRPPG